MKKQMLFDQCRTSLAVAGISTKSDRSVICPLCWQETAFEDLSLEHAVPRCVGGTDRTMTLTCVGCNNNQGSELDSHLAGWQRLRDALNGHGHTPVEMNVEGHRMTANLKWGSRNFVVVGAATNPQSVSAVQQAFAAGAVKELTFTFNDGYSERRLYVALLRAAYLCVFRHYGYKYLAHEIVQVLRRRIADPMLEEPNLKTLICELKPKNHLFDESHGIARCDVSGVECFLVILRLRLKGRSNMQSYFGVYLPVTGGRCEEFFTMMERHANCMDGKSMSIPASGLIH